MKKTTVGTISTFILACLWQVVCYTRFQTAGIFEMAFVYTKPFLAPFPYVQVQENPGTIKTVPRRMEMALESSSTGNGSKRNRALSKISRLIERIKPKATIREVNLSAPAIDDETSEAVAERSNLNRGFLQRPPPIRVQTSLELERLVDLQQTQFRQLSVVGEDVPLSADHPVASLLIRRMKEASKPGARTDKFKVGLAIEGGGMRGCVSAGMAACIEYLGFADSFDAVYGSSAGAVVGAYFVTRQLDAVSIYTQVLPTAGKEFVNPNFIPKAAFGIQAPRFMKVRAAKRRRRVLNEFRRLGRRPALPVVGQVMSLDLLAEAMFFSRPLRWDVFKRNNKLQPLNIIASGVNSMRSRTLSSARGHFSNMDQLVHCLKASSNVPGAVGPPLRFPSFKEAASTEEDKKELLCDALVMEPMPYRSAVEDGCTHVLVLRTRPNGAEIMGSNSPFYESVICQQYFSRDYDLPNAAEFTKTLQNVRIYADDVLTLNAANKEYSEPTTLPRFPKDGPGANKNAYLMTLAVPKEVPEVGQMVLEKEKVLEGVRAGFETAFEALAPELLKKVHTGRELALKLFPDQILDEEVDLTKQITVAPKEISSNGKPHLMSLLFE